ncbi:20145_t:CDS:2, partial [Cetraspora pellucida]
QQKDLIRSEEYEVLKFCNNIYKIKQLDDKFATNIFKKLPEYHHDALLNIMQSASEYILEDGKISKLQKDLNILQHNNLNTTNINDITNYKEIKMPIVKHSCGHSPNN